MSSGFSPFPCENLPIPCFRGWIAAVFPSIYRDPLRMYRASSHLISLRTDPPLPFQEDRQKNSTGSRGMPVPKRIPNLSSSPRIDLTGRFCPNLRLKEHAAHLPAKSPCNRQMHHKQKTGRQAVFFLCDVNFRPLKTAHSLFPDRQLKNNAILGCRAGSDFPFS